MAAVLLAGAADPQAQRVAAALDVLGAPHVLIDTAAFPEALGLSLDRDGMLLGEWRLPVPAAVYVRGLACHPLVPSLSEALEAHPRRVIAAMEEKRALLESLLLQWRAEGALLVNGPEANAQHSRKPMQLHCLHLAGLPVPAWLATNDPERLQGWLADAGPCVYKPLAGGATVRRVEAADLSEERLAQLAAAPVLFQRMISGVSVRAFVVDGEVAGAAEIHSEELDYRRGETAVVRVELSEAETRHAVAAARACGMAFAGIDFIRAPEHSWLLECNPSPMFAVFEEKTGCDIAGPLARLLARAF